MLSQCSFCHKLVGFPTSNKGHGGAKKPVRRAKKLVLWAKLDTGTRGAEYSSNFLIVLSLSVIATAPSSGDNGTWSDRKLAAGKKLVGISVKMNKDGNSICKIRAR